MSAAATLTQTDGNRRSLSVRESGEARVRYSRVQFNPLSGFGRRFWSAGRGLKRAVVFFLPLPCCRSLSIAGNSQPHVTSAGVPSPPPSHSGLCQRQGGLPTDARRRQSGAVEAPGSCTRDKKESSLVFKNTIILCFPLESESNKSEKGLHSKRTLFWEDSANRRTTEIIK